VAVDAKPTERRKSGQAFFEELLDLGGQPFVFGI
jgi:hypothetical protein